MIYLDRRPSVVAKFHGMNCTRAPDMSNRVPALEFDLMSTDCKIPLRIRDNDAYANRFARNSFCMHDNAEITK